MKICSRCKRELNESEYNKNCKAKDGLCTICRSCQKEWREQNHEKILAKSRANKEYFRQYDEKRKNNTERKEQKKQNYQQNKERYNQQSKANYYKAKEENWERVVEYRRQYYKNNKEQIKRLRKQYYEENRDKILLKEKEYYNKNREIIKKKDKERNKQLPRKISKFMHNGLSKSNIKDKHWELYFKYTFDELKEYLEKQFTSEMNWDNYSRYGWHIDHIIPQNILPYSSIKDDNFKICWCLENLRPLWHTDNLCRPRDGSDVIEENAIYIISKALNINKEDAKIKWLSLLSK